MREMSVAEQRYRAVLAVISDGREATEVAGQFGVSRQTVHTWLRRYEQGGLEGLVDRSHRPGSCPHQMDPVIEVRVLELRRAHRYWGPRRIRFELARSGVRPVPSESGIYRALLRAGMVEHQPRHRRDEHWRRWERGRPMELWQLDVVGGFLLADGSHAKALTGIDDHSRFCVSAYLMRRERQRSVCEGLGLAMRTYGVPEEILTDNGKVFTGRFNHPPVEVLFDRILRENGIEHRLTQPRSPTTTGKIERFHRSLRAEFLTGRIFADLDAAQRELDGWVRSYNTERPHQSCGMQAPASRFGRLPRGATDGTAPVELGALSQDRTGDGWVARRVASNGVIAVSGQQISVGVHRVGARVDVDVRPDLLQIWHGPELLKTVKRTSRGEVRKKRASEPWK
jgi:transposase InsO family protein